MKPRDYLLDRLPLLLAFAAALAVLLLVVHLAYRPLRAGDVAYIVLLAVVATAVILAVDHLRHRPFRREVAARLASRSTGQQPSLDRLAAPLPRAASRELRAMAALLDATNAQAAAELQHHRTEAERHRAFIDLWVHQMKTPVAVLELTARQQQAAGDAATSQAAGAAWRSVAEETDALANGLDLMLSTARLERFELDLRPEVVDLGAAARSAVNELKRSWIRSSVYPKIEAPDKAVSAETDPKWLQVVLRQLLTNAIKYSSEGDSVTITVARHGDGGTISVTDTGIGIPPEDVPRVFERFYTGANGRRGTASTGMGLYLAAEICRRLGHELDLESTLGRGTTVRVSIAPHAMHVLRDTPRAPEPADGDAAPTPGGAGSQQGDAHVRFGRDA